MAVCYISDLAEANQATSEVGYQQISIKERQESHENDDLSKERDMQQKLESSRTSRDVKDPEIAAIDGDEY